MSEPSPPVAEPGNLRLLRILVTVLTVVMIAGFLVIVALIVIRFSSASEPAPALPESITLPDGATATAFTVGPGWYAVVTTDNRILIYDATSGALRQSIAVDLGK